jgi:Glycosyl hydrolase catalytic core
MRLRIFRAVVAVSLVAAALTPSAGQATLPPGPVLSVHGETGETLRWTAVGTHNTYRLLARGPGIQTITTVVGRTFTPPPVAGATIQYHVKAAYNESTWGNGVSISYPSAEEKEKEKEEAEGEPPPEEPEPPSMWVGLQAGGWGAPQYADVAGAVSYVRLDSGIEKGCSTQEWTRVGIKVICDMAGPYNTGGVKALNISEWVKNAVAVVKANPDILAVEVLNEPSGRWYFGPEAESAENAAAYARLLRAVHEAFVANFGSARPLILGSYVVETELAWGERVYAADPNVGNYVDGWTAHPYGGTGARLSAALGHRDTVEAVHAKTGKPVYVTEVGWLTGLTPANGVSLVYTEAEQAENIKNFITWARRTGYVGAVMIFGYRDYGDLYEFWGVETHEGRKKPSYGALREAAAEPLLPLVL